MNTVLDDPESLARITITLPEALLTHLDRYAERREGSNRSRAVRQAVRIMLKLAELDSPASYLALDVA